MEDKLKIAFVNPPHADWALAANLTFLMMQSHYNRFGKYSELVDWLPPPYKWNKYMSYNDVWQEIKEADVILFSSYTWNAEICDELAKIAKENNKITVLGGPHIGTNEPKLLESRMFYDYICQPTKPGEVFIEDFINSWFENTLDPENIVWELRSKVPGKVFDIGLQDYSVYEDHFDYLKQTFEYATEHSLEPTIILETTRGCPYKCVFCEWGGGIGTKIYKKQLDIVKRDILALKKIGFIDAYQADANFGAFFERDLEIYKFAWENNFYLTDISQVKLTSYEKRKKLVDAWFDIVKDKGSVELQVSYEMQGDQARDMFHGSAGNIVPNVALQTLSDEAMKVAKRVDLSAEDKVKLAKHIHQRCLDEGFHPPGLETILGMPGSTINDFYNEMELIYYFQEWNNWRYDYMFLPDSDLNSEEYKAQYKIETVETFFDIDDTDDIDNLDSLYKDKKQYFKTIISCYSFTREEYKEMWFMNNAGNHLLEKYYNDFKDMISPAEFCKKAFYIIKEFEGFDNIWKEIEDILDPDTPARSIKKINGRFRHDVIAELIDDNNLILKSLLLEGILRNAS